jgi:hypothetical protein
MTASDPYNSIGFLACGYGAMGSVCFSTTMVVPAYSSPMNAGVTYKRTKLFVALMLAKLAWTMLQRINRTAAWRACEYIPSIRDAKIQAMTKGPERGAAIMVLRDVTTAK